MSRTDEKISAYALEKAAKILRTLDDAENGTVMFSGKVEVAEVEWGVSYNGDVGVHVAHYLAQAADE